VFPREREQQEATHMANQRRKAQVSNAVAINKLQHSFNGLLQTLSKKDEVNSIYLAAIADAFQKLAPEKFTGPDGKPLNIYLEYIRKEFPHLLEQTNDSGE
jgi:hypothetical protein